MGWHRLCGLSSIVFNCEWIILFKSFVQGRVVVESHGEINSIKTSSQELAQVSMGTTALSNYFLCTNYLPGRSTS
jgi:hypothetical protein